MTTLAAFYDHILPEVPGVTSALVDFALRQVAREFCERSQIHIVDLPAINSVAGTATYTLTSNVTDTEVCAVRAVWYDTWPLDIATLDVLDSAMPDWRTAVASNRPCAYTLYDETTLTLYPTPATSITGGLKVQVAVRPTLAAATLTGWIATRWMDALAAGVKARLFLQPGKPWTNAELSMAYRSTFMKALGDAIVGAQRSLTRASLQVQLKRNI